MSRPRDSSLFFSSKSEARSSDARHFGDLGSSFDPASPPAGIIPDASTRDGSIPFHLPLTEAQKAKYKMQTAERKWRTKISLLQDAVVRWKATAEAMQQQRDELSVDLQRALDEIHRIGDMEMQRTELFRRSFQDREDRFMDERQRWELEFQALHRKYERSQRKRKNQARRLRMYSLFPPRPVTNLCSNNGMASFREEMLGQMKRLNTEVGHLSRMMKVLDSRMSPLCNSRSDSLLLPADRKLSLASKLTDAEGGSVSTWLSPFRLLSVLPVAASKG